MVQYVMNYIVQIHVWFTYPLDYTSPFSAVSFPFCIFPWYNTTRMNKISVLWALCIVLYLCHATTVEGQNLFEKDSKNWEILGNAKWTFSNDVLTGEVKDEEGFIVTKASYQDFMVELEFKPDSTINSGVYIRCTKKVPNATDCHEINIWDLHPNQDFRTGAIVAKQVPKVTIETLNRWNTYRIRVSKSHIKVWLNDTLTAELNYEYPPEGYIALQAAGKGTIQFRNIRIKTLN